MPRPTPMGIRHEVFALAREGIKQGAIAARVGLTRATVNRILKRHAATGSLVPGTSSGAPRKATPRQDRALLRMVRQDHFLSARALMARMRNLYGMRAGRTTVNNRLLSRGYRAYRPTTKPLLTANHRRLRLEWAQRWRNLTVAHWQHVIFGDESRFQLYPVDGRLSVRCLPGELFRPGCQAHRVQAGDGSVHVWGAFHNSAKSPLVLPDGYLTGVLYRGILQNTLVPFARHYFGDNYRYQDDNATPHRARVVLDFLQQGNVTKMEQPPRSPDCNPIEHLWDELGRAISSMDNPPHNLDELRQALLDKWAQFPVQHLQRLVASMPRRLAAIIAARGGNTRYWPGTHKTRPPGSVTNKIIFVRPNLPQLSSSDILVCTFGQLLILSSNVVKTDKTQQNKKIGHQIHRKHYITPNNLSLDLADWWNRNNHKKDASSRGVTTFFHQKGLGCSLIFFCPFLINLSLWSRPCLICIRQIDVNIFVHIWYPIMEWFEFANDFKLKICVFRCRILSFLFVYAIFPFVQQSWYTISGPFYQHGLTLIPTWISNHIHYNVWDEITYPFLNFNGCTVEV